MMKIKGKRVCTVDPALFAWLCTSARLSTFLYGCAYSQINYQKVPAELYGCASPLTDFEGLFIHKLYNFWGGLFC